MLLNCGVGEDSWESLGLQGDPTSPSERKSVLNIHWKYWCWSWSSNTLATWWEELTHWKRPWCWERLKEGGEGDDRGWDGWMASLTQRTWVWVSSSSWWWTGRPCVLQSMGSQRVRHDWVTELNWLTQKNNEIPNNTTKQGHVIKSHYFTCWLNLSISRYCHRYYINEETETQENTCSGRLTFCCYIKNDHKQCLSTTH